MIISPRQITPILANNPDANKFVNGPTKGIAKDKMIITIKRIPENEIITPETIKVKVVEMKASKRGITKNKFKDKQQKKNSCLAF